MRIPDLCTRPSGQITGFNTSQNYALSNTVAGIVDKGRLGRTIVTAREFGDVLCFDEARDEDVVHSSALCEDHPH